MLKTTYSQIVQSLAGAYSRFTFTPSTQRYSTTKGTLPPDTVRVIVDKQIAVSGAAMERWGDELRAVKGQPGWEAAVDRWAVQFREERRALELQCASAGRGGLHSTTIEAYDRAEAINAQQFKFHDVIVQKLKDDPDYVDTKTFEGHGDGYARTARFSYENERIDSHKAAGFKWRTRWTHSITPCAECAALDGVPRPIDEGPALGECICGPACDCTEEITMENPDD